MPLTQELIGDVNRALRALRSDGLIDIRSRCVTILDFDALSQLCDFDNSYLGETARARCQKSEARLRRWNSRPCPHLAKADKQPLNSSLAFDPELPSTVNCFALRDSLFDHLVGGGQQRFRDGEAERLGGVEIDGQLEPGGPLHWEIASLFPFEDTAGVSAEDKVDFLAIGSVAHQAAGGNEPALTIDGRNCKARHCCDDLIGMH
jgi:hypothetical protein